MKIKLTFVTLFILFTCINLSAQETKQEVMPEPIGGMAAIMKNLAYPESAKEAGIQGKVYVKAVIDEKGDVISAEVIKSLNNDCDKSAVSAIQKTKFSVGMDKGKPVRTEIVIPIYFRLQ